MRKYEVIFIVRPLEDEATEAVIGKFSKLIANNSGVIDKEDRWGRRKLAYPIKDCTDGYYCLFYVSCEPDCVKECDRVMKITDDVLKHMIVKSEGFSEEEAKEAAEETPSEE
ncbi:MAG: 30S ribosomal protein S6 [Schwartzia sp.]|nr:30S ribosomal protein S6 [Schwartzia sp. (in: firmicutes)]